MESVLGMPHHVSPAPLGGQKHHFCCRLRPGMVVVLPLPAAPANSLPPRPLSCRLAEQMAKTRRNGKGGDDLLKIHALALDNGQRWPFSSSYALNARRRSDAHSRPDALAGLGKGGRLAQKWPRSRYIRHHFLTQPLSYIFFLQEASSAPLASQSSWTTLPIL